MKNHYNFVVPQSSETAQPIELISQRMIFLVGRWFLKKKTKSQVGRLVEALSEGILFVWISIYITYRANTRGHSRPKNRFVVEGTLHKIWSGTYVITVYKKIVVKLK